MTAFDECEEDDFDSRFEFAKASIMESLGEKGFVLDKIDAAIEKMMVRDIKSGDVSHCFFCLSHDVPLHHAYFAAREY
jgi:hypothetical protein